MIGADTGRSGVYPVLFGRYRIVSTRTLVRQCCNVTEHSRGWKGPPRACYRCSLCAIECHTGERTYGGFSWGWMVNISTQTRALHSGGGIDYGMENFFERWYLSCRNNLSFSQL